MLASAFVFFGECCRIRRPLLAYTPAMGGFFLDSIVSSIVKKVRANSRVSTAEGWLIVEGKVSRLGFNRSGSLIVPTFSYSYEVNGEPYYGATRCVSIREDLENEARESIEELQVLRVRYDSADPFESRLLNEDNPGLRLKIDHETY